MVGTHHVEMPHFIGVEVLEPHHTGDAINAVSDFGWLVAAELFATTNHAYNSREHTAAGGESAQRHRTTAAHLLVGDAGLDPTTSTM